MVSRRARLVVIIIAVVIVSAGSVFVLWRGFVHTVYVTRTRPGIILGSAEIWCQCPYSPEGWLMPSDTLISTSYVANQTFDTSYMHASVLVLNSSLYQLEPGTNLTFGLYINARLMGTQTCRTGLPISDGGWAAYGSGSNETYTLNSFECGASLFNTPFAAGSVLTVTVWSDRPIWVQVDHSPTTSSYEAFNVTSSVPSRTVNIYAGNVAPRTITVDAYSD